MRLKNRGNIGKKAIFVTMRIHFTVLLLFVSLLGYSQKFRFNSSIGTSIISWHENQATFDFGAEISFQKPDKKQRFFIALKTLGNLSNSTIDRNQYTFIEPPLNNYNQPITATEPLYSQYRGGQAEAGIIWNTQNKSNKARLIPSISLYSKSIGRKINSSRRDYIEEEKYSIHGLSAGIGVLVPGKTSLSLQVKVFEPFFEEVTLYGRYVGVPYQRLVSEKVPNYKAKLDIVNGKFGLGLEVEILNLGGADNANSKSIQTSQALIPSTLLTYFF